MVDPVTGTITVAVDHFTVFAVQSIAAPVTTTKTTTTPALTTTTTTIRLRLYVALCRKEAPLMDFVMFVHQYATGFVHPAIQNSVLAKIV